MRYTTNMKNTKKHSFAHVDPEQAKIPEEVTTRSGKVVTKKEDNIPKFVYRDLGRTTYIIGGFIALLVALYIVQIKTNWLAPVLHIFGI